MEVSESQLEGLMAGLGAFFIILVLILIAVIVFYIVAMWKLYKKAGKGGWEAIIPFYNNWVYVEISGLNWWWFLLLLAGSLAASFDGAISTVLSLAGLFATFVCNYNLAKKFHKDTGYAVLMTIFPIVMIPILAFGKDNVYDANVEVSKNGVF